MMNRSSSKDALVGAGGRNHNNNNSNHNAMTNGIFSHRRGMSLTRNNNAAENFNSNNNMDLFSRSRTSLPAASSDESDLQARLARLSVGSAKPAKSILDDLLSSNEGGKNDYDWLLTPPGTPLVPLDGKESQQQQQQPARVTTRSRSTVRSSSINKTSRLSVSQNENNNNLSSRPARSSSVTRSSISTSQYTTNYSTRNTNILNTSSASVSSYIRPSTPTRTSRPSTPSSTTTRTTPSRTSTPSRTRPTPTTSTRPSQTTRPSTPTSRPQTPGNNSTTNTPNARPVSRSSTPTRRTLTPSLTPSTSSINNGLRGLSSGPRSVGSGSRPSSPSPRVRPPPQPMNIVDFSHETPPNLRTTLPDRPLSAGRSRPGASLKGNLENSTNSTGTGSLTRRHSSPNVVRGRLPEPSGRTRPGSNGHVVETLDSRRSSTSHLPQSVTRKPVKSVSSENGSSGFGRNISKKSLDMAIKHMDIRNGGVRPLSGSTLFPQSIRSTNSRAHATRASSVDGGGSENGSYSNGYSWNRDRGGGPGPGPMEDESPHSYKLSSEVDIYESSRYDAILLKEDLKNTSWLHTGDDKNDEGLLFDNGFESLPEPFSPL